MPGGVEGGERRSGVVLDAVPGVGVADDVVLATCDVQRRLHERLGVRLLGLAVERVALRDAVEGRLVDAVQAGQQELQEGPGVVGRLHDRVLAVLLQRLPQQRLDHRLSPEHGPGRDVPLVVLGDEDTRHGRETQHLRAELVRDVPRDHPAERAAQDRERLVAEARHDLVDRRLRDLLRAVDAVRRRTSRTGEVEVDPSPAARPLERRLQREETSVVDAESVEEDDGGSGACFVGKHAATLQRQPWTSSASSA